MKGFIDHAETVAAAHVTQVDLASENVGHAGQDVVGDFCCVECLDE